MSRMIDRLSELSREAGSSSVDALTARTSIDAMEQRVRRGVRARRLRIGVAAAAAGVVVAAGVVAAPVLLRDIDGPSAPATTQREIVGAEGGLTVYSDGSMSVVTSRGDIVEVPAAAPDGRAAFSMPTRAAMCAPVDQFAFDTGWEYADPAYVALLSFGRQQSVDRDGYHLLAQGQTLTAPATGQWPALAFQLEADVDVAPHLALRSVARITTPEGFTVGHQSVLDAAPEVTVTGDVGRGTASGQVQSRPLAEVGYCVDAIGDGEFTRAMRFLEVDVFLTDRDGNATLLGTFRTWSAIEASA